MVAWWGVEQALQTCLILDYAPSPFSGFFWPPKRAGALPTVDCLSPYNPVTLCCHSPSCSQSRSINMAVCPSILHQLQAGKCFSCSCSNFSDINALQCYTRSHGLYWECKKNLMFLLLKVHSNTLLLSCSGVRWPILRPRTILVSVLLALAPIF